MTISSRSKNKSQKKRVPKKTKQALPKSSGPVTDQPTSTALIVFGRKTKIFLMILLIIYFGMSFFKIHTSSVANWDKLFGKKDPESVIAGEPRWIRMDEWRTNTPNVVGQYNLGLPLTNKSLGEGSTPLIWGFPVKDMSSVLRPVMW